MKNIIPKGYSVGIVIFSDVASTVATLREINSEGVRDELVTKLPKGTGGGTGIGRGLLRGVEVSRTETICLFLRNSHYQICQNTLPVLP